MPEIVSFEPVKQQANAGAFPREFAERGFTNFDDIIATAYETDLGNNSVIYFHEVFPELGIKKPIYCLPTPFESKKALFESYGNLERSGTNIVPFFLVKYHQQFRVFSQRVIGEPAGVALKDSPSEVAAPLGEMFYNLLNCMDGCRQNGTTLHDDIYESRQYMFGRYLYDDSPRRLIMADLDDAFIEGSSLKDRDWEYRFSVVANAILQAQEVGQVILPAALNMARKILNAMQCSTQSPEQFDGLSRFISQLGSDSGSAFA